MLLTGHTQGCGVTSHTQAPILPAFVPSGAARLCNEANRQGRPTARAPALRAGPRAEARALRAVRPAGAGTAGYLSGGMLYSCKARVMMSLKTGAATELP